MSLEAIRRATFLVFQEGPSRLPKPTHPDTRPIDASPFPRTRRDTTMIRRSALCLAVLALAATGLATAQQAPRNGPDTAALVKGNNQFALDLYGQLREKDGNLFCSPFSISTA